MVTLTCSIIGRVSHLAVGAAPPEHPGGLDAAGVRLWLGLQVEGAQKGLLDGLQRHAMAPGGREHFGYSTSAD